MADNLVFQDQIYIDHLREALWDRSVSFASVMVGAGFSLNAEPIGSGLSRMPTWRELVTQLIDDLYPAADKDAAWHRSNARMSVTATSGMLRLAEEYEVAFGRDHLDQRLMQF